MPDKPELRWVPIKDLYVDRAYQRGMDSTASQRNIAKMVADFQWSKCGAITVCLIPKTDKYAVIDGQHRLHAAKTCGAKEMPCMVIVGYEVDGQAKNFLAYNRERVNMNPLSLFHAAMAAKEPEAVDLQRLLDSVKIAVCTTVRGDTGPRETTAISTLLKLVKTHNEKHIKFALSVIPEAYGESKGMLRSMLIKACAEFSSRNPQCNRSLFAGVLRGIDPKKMEAEVSASVKIQGGTNVAVMADMLEKLYRKAEKAA